MLSNEQLWQYIREEFAGVHKKLDEKTESHEKRLNRLEQTAKVTTTLGTVALALGVAALSHVWG